MPVQTRDIYICDTCSRHKESRGLPTNWKRELTATVVVITCPYCIFQEYRKNYAKIHKAAADFIKEEEEQYGK